jgi:hypothetical protein
MVLCELVIDTATLTNSFSFSLSGDALSGCSTSRGDMGSLNG